MCVFCVCVAAARQKHNVANARIINGTSAEEGRYPYAVSVQIGSVLLHRCSGSLVAPDIVLTHAACAFRINDLLVRTDPYRLNQPRAVSEIFGISQFLIHPEYSKRVTFENNAMLMKLNGTSTRPTVRINDDPTIPVENGQPLLFMGWGSLVEERPVVYPNVMQLLDTVTINKTDCVARTTGEESPLNLDGLLTDDMVCTLAAVGSLCNGDTGKHPTPSLLLLLLLLLSEPCQILTLTHSYLDTFSNKQKQAIRLCVRVLHQARTC